MGQSGKYFAVANGLGHVDDILREDVRIPQALGHHHNIWRDRTRPKAEVTPHLYVYLLCQRLLQPRQHLRCPTAATTRPETHPDVTTHTLSPAQPGHPTASE